MGKKNKNKHPKEENDEYYEKVEKDYQEIAYAVKPKHEHLVKESIKRQYIPKDEYQQKQQRDSKPNRDQKPNRKYSKTSGDSQQHFKQYRNDRRMEKNLKSQMPAYNDEYASRKSKKQFSNYDVHEADILEYYDNPRQQGHRRRDSESEISRDQIQRNRRRQQNDFKKKKNLFDEYLSQEEVIKGVSEQTLFEGIFYSNENKRDYASIKCPLFPKKVLINSLKDQNRALHGSLVVFKVIGAKDKKEEVDESSDELEVPKPVVDVPKVQKQVQPIASSNEDDWEDIDDDESEEEEQITKPIETKESKLSKLQKQQLIGSIVFIKKNPYENRDLVGKVTMREKDRKGYRSNTVIEQIQNDYYLSFKSVNKRLTFFNVDCWDVKVNTIEEFKELIEKTYYAARIKEWRSSSAYPLVTIIKEIGVQGNIAVEAEVLLIENQVYTTDFSEACQKEMPQEYQIPEEEIKSRLDLRNTLICTVDPVTARDLDDALSITKIGDIYEVGVHIADVSHFVREGTEVDKEAILRTTSVYLVHQVIPMLPRALCEVLCSLNPQVERLAISVFFYLDSEGNVLWDKEPRFAKSVIKSAAKLSYDIVNELIHGNIQQLEIQGQPSQALTDQLLLLNTLGQKRRTLRLKEQGALVLEKHKMRFALDENLQPIELKQEQRAEAQFMVEEYMLLANQFVGKKLVAFERATAVLRNHIAPTDEKTSAFKQLLAECKFNDLIDNLDVSTSAKLKITLDLIKESEASAEVKTILQFRLLRLMETARYFVVEDTEEQFWRHYALNFDVYTHFTSPIRRYPDILAHRLLFNAIQDSKAPNIEERKVQLRALMQTCNDCKTNARRVSDGCDKIFMCLYLRNHPVIVDAYITQIRQRNAKIIIPEYNLEKDVDLLYLPRVLDVKTYPFEDLIRKEPIEPIVKDEANPEKAKKEKKEIKNQELVAVLSYQDGEHRRLFILRLLHKYQVRLSATNGFPIDYEIDILI